MVASLHDTSVVCTRRAQVWTLRARWNTAIWNSKRPHVPTSGQ